MFIDPFGRRMPHARVRVFQSGLLITDEGAEADARGQLDVEIGARTNTLFVEWAPASMSSLEGVPFRCRYHVDLGSTDDMAAARRLENLGFWAGASLEENIARFQRALPQLPRAGSDVALATVRSFHDRGELHPFALPNAFEDSPALSQSLLAQLEPVARSHLAALADALGSSIPGSHDALTDAVSPSASPPTSASGGIANRQGAVGPRHGFLHVIAFDIGLTPNVHDVQISARSVASISTGGGAEIQKPAFADSVLAIYSCVAVPPPVWTVEDRREHTRQGRARPRRRDPRRAPVDWPSASSREAPPAPFVLRLHAVVRGVEDADTRRPAAPIRKLSTR